MCFHCRIAAARTKFNEVNDVATKLRHAIRCAPRLVPIPDSSSKTGAIVVNVVDFEWTLTVKSGEEKKS